MENKVLVLYFSRNGQNYVNHAIKDLAIGNTCIAATMIQEITQGDLFEIQSVDSYSKDYKECVMKAKEEFTSKARPKLVRMLDSIDAYDTVYIGYPNWCGTCPMPVFTFLEAYDFTGKTIRPFCTNEGSGLANSVADIRQACKGAIVENGISLRGATINDARQEIEAWINIE